MVRNIIICIAILLAVVFSQPTFKAGGEARLSPRLLNYQGYLTDALGNPITNPSVSMTFAIFDAVSAGNQKWTETQPAVSVDKGIFNVFLGSVTPIPDSVFLNSANRWLQLTVAGQVLSPRTQIVSAPYSYTSTYADTAVYARSARADTDWIFSGNNIYSGVSGNVGIGTASPTAKLQIYHSVTSSDGTVGHLYLQAPPANDVNAFSELALGGRRAGLSHPIFLLRAKYNDNGTWADRSFSIIGQPYASGTQTTLLTIKDNGNVGINTTAPLYALDVNGVICGGASDTVKAVYGGVLSGYSNLAGDEASDTGAVVVSGWNNSAIAKYSFVGGGRNDSAIALYSYVGGGLRNKASNDASTVCGGVYNNATGISAIIGGGQWNLAALDYSTVSGGYADTANGQCSFVGGGLINKAGSDYATVVGGSKNFAFGDYSTVCGGYADTTSGFYTFVGGGYSNTASGIYSVVCGGSNNSASNECAFIGGGQENSASNPRAFVGAGICDTASGWDSFVGGGERNTASGDRSVVCGGHYNYAGNTLTFVGGGYADTASGLESCISGGAYNVADTDYATVSGGYDNTAGAIYSFATNLSTSVNNNDNNSAAFTTSHTTASNQVRAAAFSTGTLDFAMDHPDDPMNKILNQYGVSSDEVQSQYSGSVVLDASGRATVNLPDYFDDINRNSRIQLTGVGSPDVVYVVEKIKNNRFVIGGKPDMEVYWQVTAERKDIHADLARIQTPVVQEKKGELRGHSIDDDAMIGIYDGIHQKNPELFKFKTDEGRRVNEQIKQPIQMNENEGQR